MVDPGELPKLRRFKLGADGKPVAVRAVADADSSARFYEQEVSPSFADRSVAPNASSDTLLSAAVDNKKSFPKNTPPKNPLEDQHLGAQGSAFPRPSATDIAFRDQPLIAPSVKSDMSAQKSRGRWIIPAAILSLVIIVGAVLALVRPWQPDSAQKSIGSPETNPGATAARPERAGDASSGQGQSSAQSQSSIGPTQWANDICAPLRAYAGVARTNLTQLDELTSNDLSKLSSIKSNAFSAAAALSNALKMVTSAAGSNALAAAQTDLINATDKANQVLSKATAEPTVVKAAIGLPISAFKDTVNELPQTLKVAVAANEICQSVNV